jgi:hypothetical protein
MQSVAVVVQAGPTPRAGWNEVKAAIEGSDIGHNYEVLFQPRGQSLAEHVLGCLDRLYQSSADLCIRFEDDIDVNEHILHNVRTWPLLHSPQCGAGWLFDPGGFGNPTNHGRWCDRSQAYSQGVVFKRADLPWICEGVAKWFAQRSVDHHKEMDLAISHAVTSAGKRIAIHAPSLLEHRIDLPSTLGHQHVQCQTSTSRGTFAKDWRRADVSTPDFSNDTGPLISVVVQAGPEPGRPGWDQIRASIEASDIGTNYAVMFQPTDMSIREHFLAVLDRLAASQADLCLRLEDDVEVNQHILYNLVSWPELDDPRFGIGWAFDPGGSAYSVFDRKWRKIPTKPRWTNLQCAYSLGTLMYRKDIPAIRAQCAQWFAQHPSPCEQDLALSSAANQLGKWICIHAPSLLEHRIDLPSQLGHSHRGDRGAHSNGAFFKDWRRGDPVVDQYGRIVTQR